MTSLNTILKSLAERTFTNDEVLKAYDARMDIYLDLGMAAKGARVQFEADQKLIVKLCEALTEAIKSMDAADKVYRSSFEYQDDWLTEPAKDKQRILEILTEGKEE